jgi:hypothetical protein
MKHYTCIYCGKTILRVDTLKSHLETTHPEIKEKEKNEIISDFSKEIVKSSNLAKLKQERVKLKIKAELEKVNKAEELIEYKKKLHEILAKQEIIPKVFNSIRDCKNLTKIKRLITNHLSDEIKNEIKEVGLDYYVLPKVKQKQPKTNKDYNDSTISSIFPIYTPMGNKR